jgi:hypothetical protein
MKLLILQKYRIPSSGDKIPIRRNKNMTYVMSSGSTKINWIKYLNYYPLRLFDEIYFNAHYILIIVVNH